MGNLTADENHTTVQQLFCSTGLYGIHLKIFLSALNIPLCFTAFLGNILIIVAIKKVSSLHPPSKCLFSCLTATDLCVGAMQHHAASGNHLPHVSRALQTLHLYCGVYFSIGMLLCEVFVLTVTAISVDRRLALLLGIRYRQVVTLRRVRIIVVTFWIVSTLNAVTLTYNPLLSQRMAFVAVILCTVTSTLCYSRIYCRLRHRQTQVHDHAQRGQVNGGAISLNIARYRKTVSSALWLQMASLACYFPWLITSLFSQFYAPGPSLDFVSSVAGTLFLFNSTLNPILYCWKMGCIRQAVKDTVRQFWCFSS